MFVRTIYSYISSPKIYVHLIASLILVNAPEYPSRRCEDNYKIKYTCKNEEGSLAISATASFYTPKVKASWTCDIELTLDCPDL